MKINKNQILALLDKEEYTFLELQQKLNVFFAEMKYDKKKEIAAALDKHFKALIDSSPGKEKLTKLKALRSLHFYLDSVSYSFYEHTQNASELSKGSKNKPKHFDSLLECQTDMLTKILTVAAFLNLDFKEILFEGDEPCIEEYACACEFTEYLEGLNSLENAENAELERTLGSCVDMVAPSRDERIPFYESLLKVSGDVLKHK